MGEIRTVTTLVKKRDEIRASIRMYEKRLEQAKSDLAHVCAVLRLFEVSGRGQDLARYMDSYRLFKRGEPWAICAAALASGPARPENAPRNVSQGRPSARLRAGQPHHR